MYIVTTSQRIHQITVLAFVCLSLMSALSIWGYYTAYVQQPKRFGQHLQEVAAGDARLSLDDIRIDTLVANETLRVLSVLRLDMQSAGVDDANGAAELLLYPSTAYLRDETLLLNWINQALPDWFGEVEDWQLTKHSLRVWQLRADYRCLQLERHGHWQLTAILDC